MHCITNVSSDNFQMTMSIHYTTHYQLELPFYYLLDENNNLIRPTIKFPRRMERVSHDPFVH
jgi:hypothetical protein